MVLSQGFARRQLPESNSGSFQNPIGVRRDELLSQCNVLGGKEIERLLVWGVTLFSRIGMVLPAAVVTVFAVSEFNVQTVAINHR